MLTALAALTPAITANPHNPKKCAKINPNINKAIAEFCGKGDIVVPSHYASTGKSVKGVRVTIHGHCTPKQWVPSQYCRNQFHAICAASAGNGGVGTRHYGRNDCQKFTISNLGIVITPVSKRDGEEAADAEVEGAEGDAEDADFDVEGDALDVED